MNLRVSHRFELWTLLRPNLLVQHITWASAVSAARSSLSRCTSRNRQRIRGTSQSDSWRSPPALCAQKQHRAHASHFSSLVQAVQQRVCGHVVSAAKITVKRFSSQRAQQTHGEVARNALKNGNT